MKGLILLLLILTIIPSCNSGRPESDSRQKYTGAQRPKIIAKENLRFDFSARRINSDRETIEINASLFNNNSDTVYFMTASCNGEQYSLRYDTAKFILTSFINCNASYPRLMKIAPNGQYNFQAHFKCSYKETKIKLGFDLFSVDQAFDISNKNLDDLNIFDRPKDKQFILWSDEKTIK
jgi:hypothetical protein